MIVNLDTYKRTLHVSLNFFSIFLLVTFIPDIVGISSGIITNGLWVIKGTLALLVIYNYREKIYLLKPGEQLFIFIIFIYLVNIFIDIYLDKNITYGSTYDFMSFIVSIIIALSFRYDPAFCSDSSYNTFVITLGIGLFIAFFMATESPPPLIGRFDANSTVNTINYGQMGCSLCIVSMFGFFNKNFKYSKLIFSILFFLGVLSIMRAGSRSPIIVLIVVSAFYAMTRLGLLKGIAILIILGLILWLSLEFFIQLGEYFNSGLAQRIVSAVEDRDTSGRNKIYSNVWGVIKNAPFFGEYYLIPSGVGRSSYPHNFFLEVFMATGILGGLPFFIMTIYLIYKSFKVLKNKHQASWMILLFIQFQVYGMFSSSLFSSQDYWALSFFILSMEYSTSLVHEKKLANSLS